MLSEELKKEVGRLKKLKPVAGPSREVVSGPSSPVKRQVPAAKGRASAPKQGRAAAIPSRSAAPPKKGKKGTIPNDSKNVGKTRRFRLPVSLLCLCYLFY